LTGSRLKEKLPPRAGTSGKTTVSEFIGEEAFYKGLLMRSRDVSGLPVGNARPKGCSEYGVGP